MTGSSSSSRPKQVKFDEEFREIQLITASILGEALGATRDQRSFQTQLFSILGPEFERAIRESDLSDQLQSPEERLKLLRASIDRTTNLGVQADQITDQLASATANIGKLTGGERDLISRSIGAARDIGTGQIDKFVEQNFRGANEVSIGRGLRPTDAPVGNIRGRIAEEAVSQKGQLESTLAGQEASLGLQLPLQRLGLLGQIGGQFQQFSQGADQFQASLQQNASTNRLNLVNTIGQLGLGLTGLAGTGPGVLSASRPAFGTKSKSASGGISTKLLKKNGQPIDPAEVLSRLKDLPVEAWMYLWENPHEDGLHVGPYAEDFAAAFGGDDYQLGEAQSTCRQRVEAGGLDGGTQGARLACRAD